MPSDSTKSVNVSEEFDLVIEAGKGSSQYWRDLWSYRELFFFLAWRDIIVRYKQTVIGVAWSVLRPMATMLVLTFVFGKLAKLPSEGGPYPVMVFSAMLPWQLFANALSASSNSLVSNAGMLTKVFFPRLIIPTSAVIVNLVDFLISFGLLALLMLWYGHAPPMNILCLPFFLFIVLIGALGAGFWLSALNIQYRDFRYIVPFIVQFGLYVSPVGFSSSVVPGQWRFFYSLNPMVGVIDGFRWSLLGGKTILYLPGFIMSVILVSILFLSGLWYFRKTERTFADVA